MIKVCFLAGTLGRGGAERQLVYMMRALRDDARVSMRVLCLTEGEAYESEIRSLGVPITWVGRSPNKAMRAAEIVRELRRERADIVQCAQLFVNLYAVAGARASGAVEIGAVRTDLSRDLVGAWWLLGRVSLKLPRFLIANSQAGVRAAQQFAAAPERVLLLPNVLDTERFYPRPAPRDASPVRVLFLGRLYPQKRPDRFLRAVAELERRHPGTAEAWIAGDGPLRGEMEAYARSLHLAPPRVRFLGEQADSASLLREVDVVVLTSDWEGQPNTLIEALGSGLPVLSTRMGAVDEVVPPGAGIVVGLEDEGALADGLCQLVTDRDLRLRLGGSGLEHVRRERSLDRVGDRLLAIYDQVLTNRG